MYKNKYLKYKNKYLKYKNKYLSGGGSEKIKQQIIEIIDTENILELDLHP